MENFTFYSPTFFAFGKDTENDAGTIYDGDFWDFYTGKRIEEALPIGTILTIAAAGSEGSPDSVITKEEGMFKRGALGDAIRP